MSEANASIVQNRVGIDDDGFFLEIVAFDGLFFLELEGGGEPEGPEPDAAIFDIIVVYCSLSGFCVFSYFYPKHKTHN